MFDLSDNQWVKLHEWYTQIKKDVASEQWKNPELRKQMLNEETPYDGAIGGALTYSFTPTSIGTVVKVEDGFSGKIIDLTEYENW